MSRLRSREMFVGSPSLPRFLPSPAVEAAAAVRAHLKHLQTRIKQLVSDSAEKCLNNICLCQFRCVIYFFWQVFAYLSSEGAVSLSGGLWHDCDVFCCCFNHTASCFSVMARAVLIMKNVLPSFPLNQRDVDSLKSWLHFSVYWKCLHL